MKSLAIKGTIALTGAIRSHIQHYTRTCPQLNNVTTNYKEMCSNVTFWKTQKCGHYRDTDGVRCSGKKSGQSIYPNASVTAWVSRSCDDKSDQKHLINGTCPAFDNTREAFCGRHCRFNYSSKCNKCLDPHNCIGSCAIPGPSCDSCTNSSYFHCMRSGECVHPDLRCDLHPQCRYGEDEENCLEEYRLKNLVPQYATFICQSPHYHQDEIIAMENANDEVSKNEVTMEAYVSIAILSVRCNLVSECHHNKDEEGCDNEISPIIVLLALSFLSAASFILSICLKYCATESEANPDQVELEEADNHSVSLLDQIKQTDILKEDDLNSIKSIMEEKHNISNDFEEINMSLTALQSMNATPEFKKGLNRFYFDIEMKIHNSNKDETLICMKHYLSADIAKIILEDSEPDSQVALIRWSKTKSTAAKDFVENGGFLWHLTRTTKKMFSLYLDIVKDIVLVVSLLGVITPESVIDYPTFFSCQIIWLLLSSICIPLVTFAIQIAKNYPYIIFGVNGHKKYKETPLSTGKLILLRILIMGFSFLFPALLIFLKERANEDARKLLRGGKTDKDIMKKVGEIKKFSSEVSQAILEYKKNEFSFEIIIQMTVQILMLLLNYTNTKTTSGLEAIFEEKLQSKPTGTMERWDYEIKKGIGATNILVLSILWSFKTTVTTYNKMKSMEKGGFFPTKAKFVLGFRTLICTITRVGCIVFYFTPFLGLLDLMAHWKSEQISFVPSKDITMNKDTFSCWNDDTRKVQKVLYSQLYRSDYGTNPPIPPSYTFYTMMKLHMAYLIFWIIMISQMILLLCTKMYFNPEFRARTLTYKIRNVLQSLHIPDTPSDWDDVGGSVIDHRKRWKKTIQGISAMVFIQFTANLSLLWPIFVTGFEIRKRHDLIRPCIGVFPEEEVAYRRVTIFMKLHGCSPSHSLPFILP